MMFEYCSLVFLLILTSCKMISAMTPEQKEQIHQHFVEIGTECNKENALTENDVKMLQEKTLPTSPKSGCFIACMLKTIGIMNPEGMLDYGGAMELAKKVFKEEEELANISEFAKTCSIVNEKAVSDGDAGCERAKLAFTCMVDHGSKFGLDF